uniref:Cytochrome c domain-containing protein n=1 Tax=Ciona savignyi TaxID=51511 RepID=H2Z604_CIOSA
LGNTMLSNYSKHATSKLLSLRQLQTARKQKISSFVKGKGKLLSGTAVAVVGAATVTTYFLHQSAKASEDELHAPHLPWQHSGALKTLDAASIRRGYEVYRQVCAACHSMEYIAFRNLVGVSHTEDEMKAIAAQAQIVDGPDDNGKMFKRPGRLSDYFPSPYTNDEEARAANNGALPPDLSYIVLGVHGEEDYIFSLLTGYYDPPAGVVIGEDQHYNAYFAGQAIGMAQALYNEIIEYEDGTPATQSQLAKDVTVFLRWAAEPHHDKRKLYGFRALCFAIMFVPLFWYQKKRVFSVIKSKKIAFK